MSGARVLVVDDSEVTRALLVRTLARAGFSVSEARDGAEGAVVALRERPDVVVTDLEMPLMDGTQLLRLLKNDPVTAHAPVLILTSHGEAPSRYWGLATGADGYLTKDFRPEDLIATVGRLAAAAKPPAAITGNRDVGVLDVLARVAHHLDTSLMELTLTNTLLEEGMTAGDLHDACRVALATITDVADADLLAVGVVEAEVATVHTLLPRPLSLRSVERCMSGLLGKLDIPPGAIIEAQISGEGDGDEEGRAEDLVYMRLPLRDASGVLAVLPHNPVQFVEFSRGHIESVLDAAALILDNARLAQRLRELSMLDGLTHQLNRRSLHERLDEELSRARRYEHALSIVLCDLDYFKRVNDTHGHLTGDSVLRSAAQVMRMILRSADAFGRYGGEEFLAVLPETDLESARRVAERLRRAVAGASVPLPAGGAVAVTASFGVASRVELPDSASADALLSLADSRMYEAKTAGRNCVRP